MSGRRKWLSTFGLAIAVLGLTTLAVADHHDEGQKKDMKAEVGKTAPAWTMKDMKGDTHSLKDFNGKIVVLEWFNADCPWCKKVYQDGTVEKTLKDLNTMDESIVYLAVNSTNPQRVGKSADDINRTSHALLKSAKLELPILLDWEGTVGKAYDARTTPHVYVIDSKGVLRYHGAYTSRDEKATNYVVNAVRQIKAGDTVEPSYVKPWGCSVKYPNK